MQRDKDRLKDILAATIDIGVFVEGLDFESFLEEREKRYSVLYALTIVGEASNHVSPDLRARHVVIPWRSIIDFRHRVVHGYSDLDLELVWQVAINLVPALREQIQAVLAIEYPDA